jgi:hypothetical protein
MRWRWIAALAATVAVVAYFAWPRDAASPATASAAKKPTAARVHGTKVDPKTQPAATISGLVLGDEEQPIANATVCVVYGEERDCVQSGADGRYVLSNVVPDHVFLVASAARFQTRTSDGLRLDPSEQRLIDLRLDGGALELTGVVEDILGGPIAKAYVTAEGARVETDEQGRFSIWMKPHGEYRSVEARASGYGRRSQPVRVPGKVVIALAPDSTISGKVVDATTGAPLANARVVAYPHRAEATSGADGTFSFDGLAAADYEIAANTRDRLGRLGRAIPVGVGERVEGIVVEVYPAYAVVATIELAGDSKICTPAPGLNDWHFGTAPPWRDEQGRYHFDGVPPGVYTVTLGCGAVVPPLTVEDQDVAVTWRIESGGVVKGKIVTHQKRDTRDQVLVRLERAGSLKPPRMESVLGKTFELRGVPAGKYTLHASFNGADGKPVTFELANGQTIEHEIVIEALKPGRITGLVTDKNGPVSASVNAMAMNTRMVGTGSFDVETRDGRFELEVPAGSYRVFARSRGARGYSEDLVTVEGGQTTAVNIELATPSPVDAGVDEIVRSRPATPEIDRYDLTGRVVDATGAPVAGAIVTAIEKGFWQPHEEPTLRATTTSDGSFRLVSRNERINVDVYRIGGGRTSATLDAKQPATIKLAPKAYITGTVVLANGAPAPRFQVRIGDGGQGRTEQFDYTGGRFSIEDPGDAPLKLAAVVNGLTGPAVELTAGAPRTGVVLRLPTTVTITGRVIDASTRKPIANVRINGRQGLDGWAPWFIHSDQVSDADGKFTMRDLPPGPLTLEINPPVDTWSVQTMNITVPETRADIGEIGLAQVRRR